MNYSLTLKKYEGLKTYEEKTFQLTHKEYLSIVMFLIKQGFTFKK